MSTISEKVEASASAVAVSVSVMAARTRNNTHWSLDPDPEPDYSDWTIVLGWKGSKKSLDEESESEPINKKRKTSNNTQCQRPTLYRYSIHRNLVGPKSEYFSSVFLGSEHRRYTESNTNESLIQFSDQMNEENFHAVAGGAFQIILNHCYRNEDTTTEKEKEIGTGTTSIRDVQTVAQAEAQANEELNAAAPGLNKMNAPIVICLCDYFQIDSLIKIAKYNFMRDRRNDISRKDNINVNDLIHVYECSKNLRYDFNASELETYVIDECLDDPSRLLFRKNENYNNENNNNNNNTVADVADFRFWRLLFTEYYKERSAYVYSENLVKEFSLALVSYLKAFEQQQQQQQPGNGEDNDNDDIINLNQNDNDGVVEVLDGVTLQQLTDVSAFRVVSQHAALELLRFEELYNKKNNNENRNENENGQHELTNLQERCVTALGKSSWQNQDEPEVHHAEEEEDEEEGNNNNNNNNNNGRKRMMTLIDVATLREKLGHLKCTSLILQSLLTRSISTQQKLNTQTLNQHDNIEHLQRQIANLRRRNREMRSRETAMYTRRRAEEEEESATVAAPAAASNNNNNNNQRTRRIIVGVGLRGGAPPFRDEMFASLRPRINRRRPPPAFRAEYNNMLGEEEEQEEDDDSSIEEEIRM